MELKTYQKNALGVLRHYLAEARVVGPAAAFADITSDPEQMQRLGGYLRPYRPLNDLTEVPYVCLRLPTGGGKTVLAAHAVAAARDTWIEQDYPLVLWLVPTTTIRRQTVEALKKPGHPYRAALDEAFGGRVRVFDIGDFTQILPHDLSANCCVVVGTIQSLRVNNTEGRKVYAHNENLEPHFSQVPRRADGLETIEEGKRGAGTVRFSFANLMHIKRPLMIVDEAHTAVTGLSREMQKRVNPTAIIEFTATPHRDSNLLHSVSAQALKDEEMIKLPVVLAEHQTWQQAVDGALAKQAELEAIASKESDYIRPLVLFQAQDRNQPANVEVLKAYLLEQGIAEKRIAIATGDQRELDDIDLFSAACEIDFIITVEALKEGWDCSFAYVFCSLANVHNATAAEQLLGRVLRMPYAERRADPRLNKAYAHLASPTFSAAAMALRDRMVAMGFDEQEAEENIELPQQEELDAGLFAYQPRPRPRVVIDVELDDDTGAAVTSLAPEKIAIVNSQGASAIQLTGFLTPQEKERLVAMLPAPIVERVREEMAQFENAHAERISAAERGETFVVPALMAWVQGELELADTDLLLEHCDWSLLDHSAQLNAAEFNITPTANTFEIDLDGVHLNVIPQGSAAQLAFGIEVEGWTEAGLVSLLAKQVREADLSARELTLWLTKAVAHLTGARGIALSSLMQCRYVLARKLRERLSAIREQVRRLTYQYALFGPEKPPQASYEHGFEFKEGVFASARKEATGKYTFQRHFTGPDQVPAFDGGSGGEEAQCARELDSLPEVKHWIRNVAKHGDAFWLPLAHNKFYPDFVAELQDGRLLVVEYKGAHLTTSDETKEKVAVGLKWEEVMEGRGLFLLAEKIVDGLSPREQILRKLR